MLRRYVSVPMFARMMTALSGGMSAGLVSWYGVRQGWVAEPTLGGLLRDITQPVGDLFLNMLNMVVLPLVLVTVLEGSMGLRWDHVRGVGARLLGFYLLTTLLATTVGIGVALWVNPAAENALVWVDLGARSAQVVLPTMVEESPVSALWRVVQGMFRNPFAALAEGDFLAVVVFALVFGTSCAQLRQSQRGEMSPLGHAVDELQRGVALVHAALQKVLSWTMEFAPVGVFCLIWTNFAHHGPKIVGAYAQVVVGVVAAVALMVLGVYMALLLLFSRIRPLEFLRASRQSLLTAWVTRSSAAALPDSLRAAEQLGISSELASFALPLGAAINMDGVCVHLPMFAVMAVNLFGIPLDAPQVAVLLLSTIFAAVGTGGVPGGSVMLLFMVTRSLGLEPPQVATVVSLAMGVNPILDMFETLNNVAGDLVCVALTQQKTPEVRSL